MTTHDEISARHQAQRQEGADRTPTNDRGEREADPRVELTPDMTSEADPPPQRGTDTDGSDDQGGPRGRPKPVYMSPSDEARANIAKRFQRDEEGKVPFNGDPNDPEMMYGKHGRPPEQQVDPVEPEPQPEPQRQPRMITMKVRGKDVTKSEDEWLADAAKVTAADSYLEEGRLLLENARSINRDRDNRERDPADPHRPEGRNNTQDDHADPSLSADPQHPEDELEGAIEEVRYGTDSKEAANKLRQVISKEADKASDKRQLQRLRANDLTRSNAAMKAFIEANPDIANDEIASQVMEQQLYAIQREELVRIGTDESKIPKSNAQLADMHQLQRLHGMPVSSAEQMLETAKSRFVKWKGGSVQPGQQPAPRKDAPRVEVNVDRNARRAQLPNQPTRSTAPPQQVTRQPSDSGTPRSRSDVVNSMRRARGQIVA